MHSESVEGWLRLAALNLTARQKNRLLEHFRSPDGLFEAGERGWRDAGLDDGLTAQLRRAATLDAGRERERLDELGVAVVPRGDAAYPPLLATLPDAPTMLFVRGRLPTVQEPTVALVGTRRASPYGELVAQELARDLAAAGVAVISGLAAGIDARAHEAALRAGGYTAGILGCGVDVAYPRENAPLIEEMAARGAVVSEFPLGTRVRAWHFPMRNRIISGLSRAIVVVQAPRDSGALITARLAAEQGRDVLAVPGSVTDGRQSGCHELIRDGAVLVRNADDVLEVLRLERVAQPVAAGESAPAGERAEAALPALPDLTEPEAAVAGAVGLVPVAIDDIIDQTEMSTPAVQSALVTLELKNVVQRLPGNRFVRRI